MNPLAYRNKYRRNLPHIQPAGATLFVTFRLANSIPQTILNELRAKSNHLERQLNTISNTAFRQQKLYEAKKLLFGLWDKALDQNTNKPHWLKKPQIAKIVADSIHYRDKQVYDLDAYCIMSNHVHLIITPLLKDKETYHPLQAIMHSLKRYTAYQANQLLQRTGQFWHHENYDHYVRNPDELTRIRRYVLENPAKAGLVSSWDKWPWSYSKFYYICRTIC